MENMWKHISNMWKQMFNILSNTKKYFMKYKEWFITKKYFIKYEKIFYEIQRMRRVNISSFVNTFQYHVNHSTTFVHTSFVEYDCIDSIIH